MMTLDLQLNVEGHSFKYIPKRRKFSDKFDKFHRNVQRQKHSDRENFIPRNMKRYTRPRK